MNYTNASKIWTMPFFVALINNFFLFIVYYSLITILPVYVIRELKGSEVQAGLMMTIFMLSAIFVRPFSGKIIDVLGKRKTLIVAELFFGLSTFLYLWVDDLYLLLALRFFHGIWFSIVTTVLIAIANDIVPDKRKGEGLGYFAMSMNLAVVVGPFIALTAVQFFPYQSLFLGLAVAIVIGFLGSFSIKISENRPIILERKPLSIHDLFEVRAIPIAIVGCLTAFSYSSIMSFISVYAEGEGVFEYVSLFFVVFASAMILVRPFTGRLYDRRGPNYVIYPSFIFFAIGLFVLSSMHSVTMLLIAGALIGMGYGSIVPCFQTLAIQSAEKHRSSHATSTFFTLFDSGMAAGAFVLGIISSYLGYSMLYIICGIIVVITIPVYKQLSSRKYKNERIVDSQREGA
ncbi:MFS transporter [Peribacillus sp. Hz7]|uniref:MFS transporter n=1 Tax=Peribacillus sp. Hz7 TaxID=3344873 RepID=UPI0035C99550